MTIGLSKILDKFLNFMLSPRRPKWGLHREPGPKLTVSNWAPASAGATDYANSNDVAIYENVNNCGALSGG